MKRIKQKEIGELEKYYTDLQMETIYQLPKGRSLKENFYHQPFVMIAEVKPSSPSKGRIVEQIDPIIQSLKYERGGAHAISILTEQHYFKGKPEWIEQVKKVGSLPILRKDFIIDPLQVFESKQLGADVILLIAAMLSKSQIDEMIQLAHELNMEVLLEIHDEAEIPIAIESRADVIGVNNRNLQTLKTDLAVSEKLIPHIPSHRAVISESGIHSRQDFKRMIQAGAKGGLIGEYFMRQTDPSQAIHELLSGVALS